MTRITNKDEFKLHVKFGETLEEATPESATLEFKDNFEPSPKRNKDAKTLDIARGVAALANTLGGTIVVGVKSSEKQDEPKKQDETEKQDEPKKQDETDFAIGFAEDGPGDGLAQRVASVVASRVYPVVTYKLYEFKVDERSIVTICVEPLEDGIAYVDKGGGENWSFPYRDSHGVKYMHPSEVDARRTHSRRIYLALQRLDVTNKTITLESQVVSRYNFLAAMDRSHDFHEEQDVKVSIDSVTEHELTLRLKKQCVAVPLGQVDEVWQTSHDAIGLLLRCFVVVPNDEEEQLRIVSRLGLGR